MPDAKICDMKPITEYPVIRLPLVRYNPISNFCEVNVVTELSSDLFYSGCVICEVMQLFP